jgi:hypothetical protein
MALPAACWGLRSYAEMQIFAGFITISAKAFIAFDFSAKRRAEVGI